MNFLTNTFILIFLIFFSIRSVHTSVIPTVEHQEGAASAAGSTALFPLPPPPQTTKPTPLFIPNPNVPNKADVCLLVDLTGSFRDDLPNLKAQVDSVINIPGLDDARFGLAGFRDYPPADPVPCLHCFPHKASTTSSGASTPSAAVASTALTLAPPTEAEAGRARLPVPVPVPLPRPVPVERDYPYRLFTPLTTGARFRQAVLRLRAAGGGDFKESQLDAIVSAAAPGPGGCGWRPGRSRVLIAATDAGCKRPADGQNYRNDISDTVAFLQKRQIVFIGLVTGPQARACFKQIAAPTKGLVLELRPDSSNFKTVAAEGLRAAASAPLATAP